MNIIRGLVAGFLFAGLGAAAFGQSIGSPQITGAFLPINNPTATGTLSVPNIVLPQSTAVDSAISATGTATGLDLFGLPADVGTGTFIRIIPSVIVTNPLTITSNTGNVWQLGGLGSIMLNPSTNVNINPGATFIIGKPINTQTSTALTTSTGTIATGSTANDFSVTGLTAATTLTITFPAFLRAPYCTGNGIALSPITATTTTTTAQFTIAALTGTFVGGCQG
jgi:hypothetical protein